MPQSVEEILAGAKAELNKANTLSSSTKAESDKLAPKPAAAPTYKAVQAARKAPSMKDQAAQTGASIKANMENARKALSN